MDQYRLMNQINQIFARQQTPGQYMGNPMPTFSRYDFGASSPSDAYAQGLPRRMPPMQPQPMQPQPQAGLLEDPTPPFVATNPGNPQMPPAQAQPFPQAPRYDINADPNSTPTDMRLQAQTQAAPQSAGFGGQMKGYGDKMQAFGRGQGGGGGGGSGESMYAPLPSVMSAGPAGGRAGADVNLAALLRGNRRF